MTTPLNILVACERSGVFRDALIALGHNAVSCDLYPSRRPGPHHTGDVRNILYRSWDALIAHPVCRYMANSGVRWLHERPERWAEMEKGVEFFLLFENARHIPKRAVENPVLHGHALNLIGRKADQYVQPHWFGDPFKKATGWWLTGLPKLKRTHNLSDYAPSTIKAEVHLMAPGQDREEKRSQTYPHHAAAAALQWFGHARGLFD